MMAIDFSRYWIRGKKNEVLYSLACASVIGYILREKDTLYRHFISLGMGLGVDLSTMPLTRLLS
jgi:hypothetical protein